MSQDRLNVIQHYYDSILGIWNKGNCNGEFGFIFNSYIAIMNYIRNYKDNKRSSLTLLNALSHCLEDCLNKYF